MAPVAAELGAKAAALVEHLAGLGPLAVAMSGGVDSTFLLAAAQRAGADVEALLAVSPSLTRAARERAHRVSAELGLSLREVRTREFENPSYMANGPDRCYHCKHELFEVFQGILDELGSPARVGPGARRVLVDGSQADDRGDWRPGRRAAQEFGVQSPLCELGWTKVEIRAMSRVWGLETAELPSAPCLSSRIPTGIPVTAEALTRIEAAEEALARLGFFTVRVRDHGALARIELPPEHLGGVLAHREEIVSAVAAVGYREVTLDLRGYRPSGESHRVADAERASSGPLLSGIKQIDRSGD